MPAATASVTGAFRLCFLASNPKSSPQTHSISLILASPPRPSRLLRCSASASSPLVDKPPEAPNAEADDQRKLYVMNLPWDFSAEQIEKLFAECGNVKSIEVMRQKNGKSRGFGFVTMESCEEARAVVDKFHSYELMGRTLRVEFAKPSSAPRPGNVDSESGHKIFVANLAWKARSVHLKEFFSRKFTPISAKVVFESAEGRSAGYGFVGFATKEEVEAAIAELDGQELLGRPVRLKISERKDEELETKAENASNM